MKSLFALIVLLGMTAAHGQVKVASLHPLMGDLARQVGGERVQVVDIGKPGFDVHSFAPAANDLQAMASCHLVVASGKGIERYLDSLADSLAGIPILEVGHSIPSRAILGGESLHACCDEHSKGTIDPHWWHDVRNMERAAKVIEKQLIKLDPDGVSTYQAQSKALRERYKLLDRWVKAQVASIPKEQRKLVTAHAAFGYFCEAYGMEPVFVLGLSGDHEVPAQRLAEEVVKLQEEGVRAVFPETRSNPKVLTQIAKEAGASIGPALIADGGSESYEVMVKGNVAAIVRALTPQ